MKAKRRKPILPGLTGNALPAGILRFDPEALYVDCPKALICRNCESFWFGRLSRALKAGWSEILFNDTASYSHTGYCPLPSCQDGSSATKPAPKTMKSRKRRKSL